MQNHYRTVVENTSATVSSVKKYNIRIYLLICFALFAITSLVMRYLSYIGSDDPNTLQQILHYFTEEDIAQGLQYHRSGFIAAVIGKLLSFAVVYLFVFTPLARKLEDYCSLKSKNSFLLLCFYFLTTYFLIEKIIFLPLSYYFGFVHEHQFGFSHMTHGEWIWLTLKNIGVQYVLSIPLEMGALVLLKKFTRTWLYILPVASFVVQLCLSALWPIVITPIFYDYEPLAAGSLQQKIIALANASSISVDNIYKINESKYSGHTNAYFVGWGENKKIFIYDTLIANHAEDEVVSVLGHEIGHWKHNHQLQGIIISSILLFIGSLIVLWLFNAAKAEGKMHLKELYSPSSLPWVFFVFSWLSFITSPIDSFYSRALETQADREALLLTNDAKSFIDAHIKIARVNKAMLNPHPVVVWYRFSHPPTMERIALAEEFKLQNAQ